MKRAILLTAVSLLLGVSASAEEPKTAKFPELNQARKTGLLLASTVVERLQPNEEKFPGVKAWLADYRKHIEHVDVARSPDEWGAIDVDALVSKNPNFWRMTSEIFPGDPGLMLLHAGLLLADGEINRGGQIAYLALQRPGIPKAFQGGFNSAIAQVQKVNEKANAAVFAGIRQYDRGEFGDALRRYREATAMWPQNSFAWYESGLTMIQQDRIAAGKKPLANDAVAINGEDKISEEAAAALSRARQHDPLQAKAYQGDTKEIVAGYLSLSKRGLPAWEKLTTGKGKPASEEVLTELAISLQEAGQHEMALQVRHVLIACRGRFVAEDQTFIANGLRKLVPGDSCEAILKRLSSEKLELLQLVKPESPKE